MRPKDIAIRVALVSTFSGCSTETLINEASSLPRAEETIVSSRIVDTEHDSNSLESISPVTTETAILAVPSSVLPPVEFTIEDEIRILRDMGQQQLSENTTTTTAVAEAEYVPQWEDEHFLSKEAYETGNKLGDLTVTNPDGEILVNIPLFSNQNISDTAAYSEQLERGAILEVAHSDINPDSISDERGVPSDMGLLGEDGTAVIFGHRMSYINPDWDGDPTTGLEGDSQRVFEKLDLIVEGAQAVIQLGGSSDSNRLVYTFTNIREYIDVENVNGGFNAPSLLDARSGFEDGQYLKLLACTPKGSTRDRIAANFVLAN